MPDLDEAVAFFTEVLGAALLWRTAPVSGEDADMLALFHAAPKSSPRLAMMRIGPNLNVELLEWTVPGGPRREPPLASDPGVGHFAINVADIEAAASYLREKDVRVLDRPQVNRSGPMAGEALRYVLTPWDMPIELVQMRR